MTNRPILIVIFLFITLLLGLVSLLPKYQDLKISQLKIKEMQAEIKQWEEYFSNLEKTSQELEKYKDVLSKLDSAIPNELSLPSIYNFFQKTSSQSGLFLKEIGSVTTVPIDQISEIKGHSLTISLSGSYLSLKNFLSTLEKSARFFEIESISFSAPQKTGEALIFNLRIKAYSY